jgi:hypothetical protein
LLTSVFALLLGLVAFVTPASATFHLMQIEQVIVGVNGDPTAQAVQLRMRSAFEDQVQAARLRVFNAVGGSAVTLVDFGVPVPNAGTGTRILIATPSFVTVPPVTPDFIMTAIPSTYFAAGSLVYEDDPSPVLVLWRLSWGGAGYTGVGTGTTDNDVDGQFNPPYGLALPSSGNGQALRFTGTAGALSTTNAANYALTPDGQAATFTNNNGDSGQVPLPVPADHSTWGRIKSSYR